MSSDYVYRFKDGCIEVDMGLDGIICHPINSEKDLEHWSNKAQSVVEEARRWLKSTGRA